MIEQIRFLAPTEWTANSLEEILGRNLEVGQRSTLEVAHLDTFDWRIFRAGAALTLETEGSRRTLHWHPDDSAACHVLPVEGELRGAADLPDGFLKSTLEPILDIRALMSVGARQVARRHMRIVDEGGNTVLHLDLERSTVVDRSGTPMGEPTTSVRAIAGTGHESVYEEVVEQLRSAGASVAPTDHELARAAAAIGRAPGDYNSKINIALEPDESTRKALRAIFAQLLATLRANVEGVLADTDTEFLHDLRVATRRARAALSETQGVLDRDATAALRKELKWLGQVTNPCRDLDVYLLELDDFRKQLGSAASDLDPLQRMLERDRRDALRGVQRALRSARFSRLVDEWHDLVSSTPESAQEPPDSARSVHEVAGKRISEAYRKIVERGVKLGDDPPPEMLHRLRIDGKKLRYLLEFFASVYDAKIIGRLVKELKQLQDILGGYNDMTVQQARLFEFANELMASSDAKAETLLAMGRLAAAMTQRQEELYRGFADAFAAFASPRSRRRYESLFSDSGG
jgi:CHAD domain-containing protein